MVGPGVQEGRRGFFIQLKRDPSIISAAHALLVGVTDPVGFLSLEGHDWDIACTVVEKARDLKYERDKEMLKAVIDAVGKSVGGEVARQIGRMFR